MPISDYKIKNEDFNNRDIMGLPDRPSAAGFTVSQLKERFDAATKSIVMPKLNALIECLASTEGANNIGAVQIDGLPGYTLQEILNAIKLLLDEKQTISQSDISLDKKFDKIEAQSLVKSITFNETNGVITITKYDGSTTDIDTAMEKIALDVKLEGQQFILTLADGTEQRVDLSAFLEQNEVKNSDTILLAIEDGMLVARLILGSVNIEHLGQELIDRIDKNEISAKNSADSAKVSEENALLSYQKAEKCREQACSCASNAAISEQNAADSEINAENSAKEAKTAAAQAVAIVGGDAIVTKEDGTKYRFGIDEGGIFLEQIAETGGENTLLLGNSADATYFLETDQETYSIDNAVDSEQKLTTSNYCFDLK